jgi:L-2-hydroxyglutarate oxidase
MRVAHREGVPTWDVAVVGGGAVGSSTAYHLARQGLRVVLLEKEDEPGRHQSGRNSGVIHAGYNLKPGSDKARYCRAGNPTLKAWCKSHEVPMLENGAVVVAHDEREIEVLRELERRAQANGTRTRIIDGDALRDHEPHAAGIAALHAPEVASLDAGAYTKSLAEAARSEGVTLRFGCWVRSIEDAEGEPDATIHTDDGTVRARVAVNAAGLHADRLAAKLAPDLRVVAFRGTYAELGPGRRSWVHGHVYPTPDLAFPFLGVHLSRGADGRVLVGPGAMLALGREGYRLGRFRPEDAVATLSWPGLWKLGLRRDVRRLVGRELWKSMSLRAVAREAARLVPRLRRADLSRAQAGNRAQLVTRGGALVDDIVVREGPRSLHVLNAVSPGLTCSLPFGADLAARAAVLAAGPAS